MAKGTGTGIFENFLRDKSLKSLFSGAGRRRMAADAADDVVSIPQLSDLANSVVARCSRILLLPAEILQQNFEAYMLDHSREPTMYARELLEYCCYKTLYAITARPDYLADTEFRRLTFDMMLAWESAGAEIEPLPNATVSCNNPEAEDEDGASIFYTNSTRLAAQVDVKKTVGLNAFARIATACPILADLITVHNLFDALTSSSGGQLHFFVYDKYLKSLDKVLKSAKSTMGSPLASNLHLCDGEIILDVDGALPTQPVLQHIGISAWPGRLTLTTHALYFESLGVGTYDKAVKYDLAADLKQVVKRELTGPLGARLFDKAVMYKSCFLAEPICFEFPELKGSSRREYWLAIIREVLQVHRFIREFNLEDIKGAEALSRAILGIFRYRAVKEAFRVSLPRFKTILAFDLADKLPKGDMILQALCNYLELVQIGCLNHRAAEFDADKRLKSHPLPLFVYALTRVGFTVVKREDGNEPKDPAFSDICFDATKSLETAVKESFCYSERAKEARATVDQVKVEGIDTNLAVMQELLFPVVEAGKMLCILAEWQDPFKSSVFLILILYLSYRGWLSYALPCTFLVLALYMLWHKFCRKGKQLEALLIKPPPNKNAVEQIVTLQNAISRLENCVHAGNITLLKLRAVLFAAVPKATEMAALILVAAAALLTVLPFKHLVMLVAVEAYTREMPLRKQSNEKLQRRVREWWARIPAAPVQVIRTDESKKRR
uniref:DUF639 domain-containing protein n=1 Tax=Ananas comosus var. bracteatus TaxID=296719 RepID=A0A6V7PZC7_ANACO|nr:unnamed protein product [Ananas comosus var. bracteatus]